MKILQNKAGGENRIALIKEGSPLCFYFQRDISLNHGDIIQAKVKSFHPILHGYFLETTKGNAFLPDDTALTEGETITVRIKREARPEKDATAERIMDTPTNTQDKAIELASYFEVDIETISDAEMDELIDEAMTADIPLKNGGEIHIERTRIGWTIDVDSGACQNSLMQINDMAVSEIAHQVVLKNMSGLILIDFAGSKRGKIRSILEKSIQNAFNSDNRTTVSGWTRAGLFELQRTRTTASLWDMCRDNPIATYYKIVRAWATCRTGHPIIMGHPSVIALLTKYHPEIKTKPCFDKPISFFEIMEE